MAKGSSLNKKERQKKESWNIRKEGAIHTHTHTHNRLLSPLEFSRLCLMVEEKITTKSDVVLNVCNGNI